LATRFDLLTLQLLPALIRRLQAYLLRWQKQHQQPQ
jgi:hypothetical protein